MKKLVGSLVWFLILTSCSLSEEPEADSQFTRYRIKEAHLIDVNQQLVHTFRNLEEIVIHRSEKDGNYLSIDGMRIPITITSGNQVVLHPDISNSYQIEDFNLSFDPENSEGYVSTDKIVIRSPVVANNVGGIMMLTGLSGYIKSNNEDKCLNL